MANRRDLHIGITGDSAGLDAALQSAEDKARGLDRELEKLNRDMTAQERVAAATTVAVSRYGSESDKAALAARRLGNEAEQASTRAEAAVRRADAANEAYRRGLIDEEKAARASAAADRAIETAALKAAVAHQAAARAAEERARQEEQAARDADLAAAAEELGFLKANGQVQQHDQLLGHLKNRYGDLRGTAVADFEELGTAGSGAAVDVGKLVSNFSVLGLNGPVAVGAVIAAIHLLPFAAAAAGGAVALGLGGALSALAIKAQASTADVKSSFAAMKTDVSNDLQQISAPFHQTLLEISADAEAAFKSLEPSLAAAFAQMGPAITRFVRYFAGSFSELDPAIRSIGTAFSNVLDTIGPQMPTIMHNIGTGIKAITDAVASNPQALASFVTFLSQVFRYVGDTIGFLIRYEDQIKTIIKSVDGVIAPFTALGDVFSLIKGHSDSGGTALAKYENTLGKIPQATTQVLTPTQQLAHDMDTLHNSAASAADRTNALNDALTRLFDPELAAYEDTAKLRQGFDQLSAALAKSHGKIDGNSSAAAAAKLQFVAWLRQVEQTAKDMLNAGDNIDTVSRKLAPYILALYRAAGANKDAKAQVDAFLRTLGLVPPSKTTLLHNNAKDAAAAVRAYQNQINSLHGKTVTIEQIVNQRIYTTQQLIDRTSGPGRYGGATGGLYDAPGRRFHYGTGGEVSGLVSGPGSGTSDSIFAGPWLANGEFVTNAAATRANLPFLQALNSGRIVAPAAVSGASGGSAPSIDAATLARAVRAALVGTTVEMDSQPVGRIVSRTLGRQTDQRRRTG